MNHRRAPVTAIFLTMLACSAVSRVHASTLSTDVIGMFPQNIGEFAYADLKQARGLSWFPQLKQQMLPSKFKQFEQFLTSAGIDPNSQVEEVAWATVGAPPAPTDQNRPANAPGQQHERLIGIRAGEEQGLLSDSKMLPLINEANGSGVVWAVMNSAYAQLAMQQLAPEAEQFPQAQQLVSRLRALSIEIIAGSGVQA